LTFPKHRIDGVEFRKGPWQEKALLVSFLLARCIEVCRSLPGMLPALGLFHALPKSFVRLRGFSGHTGDPAPLPGVVVGLCIRYFGQQVTFWLHLICRICHLSRVV